MLEEEEGTTPAPIERFHRSPLGIVVAAGLLGLRDVIEPKKDDQPPIVEDWSGGEPFKEPYVLRLDPEHPEDSIVLVRKQRSHGRRSDGAM